MYIENKIVFELNACRCEYRALKPDDVTDEYVEALVNDTGFIENAQGVTVQTQRKYVQSIVDSQSNAICGVFYNNTLAGTSGIQFEATRATFGILVFDRYRGLGLGKSLVWLASVYCSEFFDVDCFCAGAKEENIPSIRSFLSCGFKEKNKNCGTLYFECFEDLLIKPEIISQYEVL